MEPSTQVKRQQGQLERPDKLLNRNFVLLWQGQFVSLLGGHINTVALVFIVKHATSSASLIGLMMMASSITRVVFSGIGGAVADRHSRRKIIIYSDLLRGLAVLSLAGMLYLSPDATSLIIVWLWVVAIIISATSAFFNPAMSAAIPDLVPQKNVAAANSLRHLTTQIAMFIGQSLGGVLFRLFGVLILVLGNGLSFLYSAMSESFVRIPQTLQTQSGNWGDQVRAFKREFAEGFQYVWTTKSLRKLFFVSAFMNVFGMSVVVLLPFYIEDFLNVKLDWYGYFLAIYGVGLTIGSLSAGFLKLGGRARSNTMMMFMVVNGISIVMLGFVNNLIVVMTLSLVIGMMSGFNSTNIITLVQISTSSEIRGRVFGVLNTLAGSTIPLGMGLGGVVFDLTGQNIPLIYGSCGVMMAILSIAVSLSPSFRDFLAYESPSTNQVS